MNLGWTVKTQPGKYYTEAESRERLKEAIKHLRNMLAEPANARVGEVVGQFPDFDATLGEFEKQITVIPGDLAIPRNRRANKDLTFATLTFEFFPSRLTASILRLFMAKPKTAETSEGPDFAQFGDDPIKLSRGERGYVFPAFTALPAWKPLSPGQPEHDCCNVLQFAFGHEIRPNINAGITDSFASVGMYRQGSSRAYPAFCNEFYPANPWIGNPVDNAFMRQTHEMEVTVEGSVVSLCINGDVLIDRRTPKPNTKRYDDPLIIHPDGRIGWMIPRACQHNSTRITNMYVRRLQAP
jgi:hypothetical protein